MLGAEALLQADEPLDVVVQHRLELGLVEVDTAGIGAIERSDAEALGIVDAQALEQFCGCHDVSVLQTWVRKAGMNDGIIGSKSAGPHTTRMSVSSGSLSRER